MKQRTLSFMRTMKPEDLRKLVHRKAKANAGKMAKEDTEQLYKGSLDGMQAYFDKRKAKLETMLLGHYSKQLGNLLR